mmetsp:Transcript_68415/g.198180  ORF Transcript_68415/g.198180 Transcript_68415/m.198180 type:complete len:126 (+) Transcript_68415:579-956(+)
MPTQAVDGDLKPRTTPCPSAEAVIEEGEDDRGMGDVAPGLRCKAPVEDGRIALLRCSTGEDGTIAAAADDGATAERIGMFVAVFDACALGSFVAMSVPNRPQSRKKARNLVFPRPVPPAVPSVPA